MAGAAVVQRPLVQSEFNDTLFVMGGFGGWPEDDVRYNGLRCRNDVYKTKDGGERIRGKRGGVGAVGGTPSTRKSIERERRRGNLSTEMRKGKRLTTYIS